jgi:hypothetical protein
VLTIEEIDPKAFRKALAALNEIEPESRKKLEQELKSSLNSYASRLADRMPEISPLRGMNHSFDTGYNKPKGKVSFTPGSSRKTAGRVLAIQLDAGRQRGFYIMELAGTRSKGQTRAGRTMIERLNRDKPLTGKRGGRYAWREFLKMFGDVQRIADKAINEALARLEKTL